MLIDGDFQKIMATVVSARCDRSRWVRAGFFFVYISYTYYLYKVCVWGEFEVFEEFINHYVFYYCYICGRGGGDGDRETCDADGLQIRVSRDPYNTIYFTPRSSYSRRDSNPLHSLAKSEPATTILG